MEMREKEENEEKEFNKQKQNTEKSIELECIPHIMQSVVAIEKIKMLSL